MSKIPLGLIVISIIYGIVGVLICIVAVILEAPSWSRKTNKKRAKSIILTFLIATFWFPVFGFYGLTELLKQIFGKLVSERDIFNTTLFGLLAWVLLITIFRNGGYLLAWYITLPTVIVMITATVYIKYFMRLRSQAKKINMV